MSSCQKDEDIPIQIHTKLVYLAKRGRFSHLVPPRVWGAPDGRVIPILDDAPAPLDEEFYEALLALEKSHKENNEQEEGEIVEDPKPTIEVLLQEELVSDTQPNTINSSPSPGLPISTQVTNSKDTSIGSRKQPVKSLVSWLKDSNPSLRLNDSKEDESDSLKTISSQQQIQKDGSVAPKSHGQLNSARPSYTPAHCLIHRWNPFLRSRCFVYPTATAVGSHGVQTDSTNACGVLLWIRIGCLREKVNFALQQTQWMNSTMHCHVTAVAFMPSDQVLGTAERYAFISALAEYKANLNRLGVNVFIFEQPEDVAAPSLLALWTRQWDIVGIFTTETYDSASMKTSHAVARAAKCPVFAFDSENIVPIRFIDSKLHNPAATSSSTQSNLDTFQNEIVKYQALLQNASHTISSVAFEDKPFNFSSNMAPANPPELITKRWTMFELDQLSSNREQHHNTIWTEARARTLFSNPGSITDTNLGEFFGHSRLGTISPLLYFAGREPGDSSVFDSVCYRTFVLHKAYQNTYANQRQQDRIETNVQNAPVSLMKDWSENLRSNIEWKLAHQQLIEHNTLGIFQLESLLRVCGTHIPDPADAKVYMTELLREHLVGFSAVDVSFMLQKECENDNEE